MMTGPVGHLVVWKMRVIRMNEDEGEVEDG